MKPPNNQNEHTSCVSFDNGWFTMKCRTYLKRALDVTQFNLNDFLFKCTYRLNSSKFSRKSKMGFKETTLFMMNMVKKSLQIELNDFFDKVLKKDYSISKQAYSKARQNIKPEIFADLSGIVVKGFYEECDDYNTWKGYRLSAIDGTVLELPNTDLLREEYGCYRSKHGEIARARAICLYDIQNKLIIKSQIRRYDVSERKMAESIIEEFIGDKIEKELILFDRGYPSTKLMALLSNNGIDFVMRVQKNYFRKMIDQSKEDQIIQIKHKKKQYDVRVVRFMLESGEEEILLTSLFDKQLTMMDFKKLYFMRWGIEVKYNDLKNKIEIENFTGKTKIAIEQDFYATIYIANMVELARMENEEILKEKHKDKELKYDYKPNLNVIIGTLKDQFIIMVLEENRRKRNKMLRKIIKQVSKSSVPIRPDRQYPRNKYLLRTKNVLISKRCL